MSFPPDDDAYVLCVERDHWNEELGDTRPIVWEQYLDTDSSSLEKVTALKERLGDRYGKTKIAKLVFIDDENSAPSSLVKI